MSWSGMIWHRASREQLAASIAKLPSLLAAIHPEFGLRRFAKGSGFVVKGKQLSSDFSFAALLKQLQEEHVVVAIGGERFEGPDIELAFHVRAYESPRMPSPRYEPRQREHPCNAMGGVTFNVHSKNVGIGEVRRAFVAVAGAMEGLVCGTLNSYPLMRALRERERVPAADEVPVSAGLLQVLSREVLIQLGVEARSQGYTRELESGSVLLELTPAGDFDPGNPQDVARLERHLAELPELYPGDALDVEEDERRDALSDGKAALRQALGRRLEAVLVLGHARDGVALDPGHGPLELHFQGGLILHTWPLYGDTALRLGPLTEHSARWTGPEGVPETLTLESLQGAPLGLCLGEALVAMAGFWEPSPRAWQLDFEGQLLFAFLRSGLEAGVSLGQRPDLGIKSKDWKLEWLPVEAESDLASHRLQSPGRS